MAVNKGEIGIYGVLRRDGGDNILAKTDLIQDDKLLKTQELLNQEAVNGAALATAHIANTSNPHNVTKAQVGLDKVTNDEQVKRTEMGKPLGVATLDGLGKVPSSLLPAYVDDVVEYETVDSFPKYGESGKIYVETTTNLTYRWTGTQYIEISKSIGLGETESTAYPGDKGKLVADSLDSHIKDTTNPHLVTKELIGLGNVDNTADSEKSVKNADTLDGVHNGLTTAKYFNTDILGGSFLIKTPGIYELDSNNLEDAPLKETSNVDYSLLVLGRPIRLKYLALKFDNGRLFTNSIVNYGNGDLVYGWKEVAWTSDNVASASKLKAPVKIWGQDFDGSGNITGALSGVSNINFSRDISIEINNAGNILLTQNSDNNFWCIFPYNSTSVAFSVLSKSGNVGIKTSSPKYPLDVIGIINTSSDFYKNGKVYAEPVTDTEIETMLNDLGI